MPEQREARSIIENAEQAAAAGNYVFAEDLLREAAALQEQTLGPHHPDLANTLNNLGVVCEMTDNPIDAEHYFRRAHAIATASLAPDHPFVATSSKNLHDFCSVRGRPVELPPSPPEVAAWLEGPAPPPALDNESSSSSNDEVATPSPPQKFSRVLALGALGVVALLVVVLLVAAPWDSPAEKTSSTSSPPATTIAPVREPVETTPTAPPPALIVPPPPAPIAPSPRTANSSVAAARLCTAIADWRCETAGSPVPAGPMFFYTQVKSATATTIEHRWYQGDRLHRAVQLRIEANPGAGYRTYSRNTISGERGGDWRVELRSADGTVLHEERFTVR